MNSYWLSLVVAVILLVTSDVTASAQTDIAPAGVSLADGVALVDVDSYEGCYELRNETARVVLGHHRGGRILVYERDGKNVLYLKDESNWDPNAKGIEKHLSAGRFDVGPEQLQVRGAELWEGVWKPEVIGSRTVKLSSEVDAASGLQVERVFRLDETTSRLTITQTVTNRGTRPVRQCFWSRTFANHGGVVIVPCDSNRSLMPNLYCMCPNGKTINFRPEDPAIRRVDDFLVIDGPPEHAKLGMDSVRGWVAYQTRQNQLFVKRFPVSNLAEYGELAGYNLSIWYPQKAFVPACEVEPIGPMKKLQPNESDSFTVDWWLLPRAFPEDGKVDPAQVEAVVERDCVVD
ncbi:hypothetical protein [Mariniblastus fucicola]|uniref:Uncharacterized protein n=1 Tax=Mariniblastus fucicola TaxID=980251 RepID=A0A5B9PA12_9BACT|nr:hypothetical protein [Mariniblastus fucicola]QEG23188.1 hypothetical protein MFFC18_30840 [Mariniblastus fucicola]